MITMCLSFLMVATALSGAPATFHVEVSGHGKPMLLIPGLASSGDVWKSTVERYSGQYECHVMTLDGFAGQAAAANFSLATVENDLSAYIAEKKLERPTILGHSLGGFLALSLAAHHPEQVGALIIVDSLPAMGAAGNPSATAADLKAMAGQMKASLAGANNEQRAKYAHDAIVSMVTSPADEAVIEGWSRATDWNTEVTAMTEMMGTDLRPELKAISAPTLVLGTWIAYSKYGGEPAIKHTFDTQYASLSGVKIEIAPKARHFIMYDDPQWMFAQMDQFLAFKMAAR